MRPLTLTLTLTPTPTLTLTLSLSQEVRSFLVGAERAAIDKDAVRLRTPRGLLRCGGANSLRSTVGEAGGFGAEDR